MNEIKIVRAQLITDSEVLLEDCEKAMLNEDEKIIFAADIANYITKVQKFLKLLESPKIQNAVVDIPTLWGIISKGINDKGEVI